MADGDDFYEDDEPIEDVRAAWRAGEKGVTSGTRDLSQRALSIVEQAVVRFEGHGEPGEGLHVHVVRYGSTDVTREVPHAPVEGTLLESVADDELLKLVHYSVS